MRVSYIVFAVWASGCVVNGKAFGPGASIGTGSSSGSPSGGSQSASSSGSESGASSSVPFGADSGFDAPAAAPPDGANAKLPPYLDAPADPWAAVHGDQPLRWKQEDAKGWRVRDNATECTAKRDHCLTKETWFVIRNREYKRDLGVAQADPAVFGSEEPSKAWNVNARPPASEDMVAYRTVPATRKNVAPGVLVVGLPEGPLPTNARDIMEASWSIGTVASVDFDAGTYLVENGGTDPTGKPYPRPLEGARVVVLSWKPGGKVEIVGGKRRDQLGVSASDVFLPKR